MRRLHRLARDATDLAQVREWLSGYLRGEVRPRDDRRATELMTVPRLVGSPGAGAVWAVATVRDEVDIVEASIRHLLDQGVDGVLVSDHLSTDGTRELLTDIARSDPRIRVAIDDEPGHFQKEKITRLARAAWRAGAEWIVPFDADEFWFAEGCRLAEFLRTTRAAVVTAEMHDVVPVADSGEDFHDREYLVDEQPSGDVKVAFRAHPLARVGPGNHGVSRVGLQAPGLRIAHIPYRGATQLERKFQTGSAALDRSGAAEWEGWHWRAGAGLNDTELEELWQVIRSGGRSELIGWKPSGSWRRERILRSHAWTGEPPGASD